MHRIVCLASQVTYWGIAVTAAWVGAVEIFVTGEPNHHYVCIIYAEATVFMCGMKGGLRHLCWKWLIRRLSQKWVRPVYGMLCAGLQFGLISVNFLD
jgi:hypothetical protein